MTELRLTSLTTHTINGEIYEIPLDEVLAIGAGLTAASVFGLTAIAAAREQKLRQQEQAERTPADRILQLQALSTVIQAMGTAGSENLDAIANIVKEALMTGSILPDEIG